MTQSKAECSDSQQCLALQFDTAHCNQGNYFWCTSVWFGPSFNEGHFLLPPYLPSNLPPLPPALNLPPHPFSPPHWLLTNCHLVIVT